MATTRRGYDTSLRTAYNFGFLAGPNAKPDWVEHFPYQDGLLISYWNTRYANPNTRSVARTTWATIRARA